MRITVVLLSLFCVLALCVNVGLIRYNRSLQTEMQNVFSVVGRLGDQGMALISFLIPQGYARLTCSVDGVQHWFDVREPVTNGQGTVDHFSVLDGDIDVSGVYHNLISDRWYYTEGLFKSVTLENVVLTPYAEE